MLHDGRRVKNNFFGFNDDTKLIMILSLVAFFMIWGAISSLFSSNVATATTIPEKLPPQNTVGSYIKVDTPAGETTPKQFTRATPTGNLTTLL